MEARRAFIASSSYNTSACALMIPLLWAPLYRRTVQGNSFGSWNAFIFLFLPLSFFALAVLATAAGPEC